MPANVGSLVLKYLQVSASTVQKILKHLPQEGASLPQYAKLFFSLLYFSSVFFAGCFIQDY